MSVIFFCPFCGKQSPEDEQVCKRCGRSIEHWKDHPYEERLLLTLHHPLREHRMMAIRILGQRRYERAVPVFEEMIRAGQDVYTLREIVYALSRMNTSDSQRLIAQPGDHPSTVVRRACEETNGVVPEGAPR